MPASIRITSAVEPVRTPGRCHASPTPVTSPSPAGFNSQTAGDSNMSPLENQNDDSRADICLGQTRVEFSFRLGDGRHQFPPLFSQFIKAFLWLRIEVKIAWQARQQLNPVFIDGLLLECIGHF